MESSFADAANNHRFKRARWRGLWKQSIQDLLIPICQNLGKLAQVFLRLWRLVNSSFDLHQAFPHFTPKELPISLSTSTLLHSQFKSLKKGYSSKTPTTPKKLGCGYSRISGQGDRFQKMLD
jgi:hypothetical protein